MKKAFTTILILATLFAAAQNSYAQAAQQAAAETAGEKSNLKDTVLIPVFEKTDTLPASFLYAHRTFVRHGNGYVLLKGFKANGQWAQKPTIVGVLNEKKQPIKNVIQIL